MIIPLIKLKNSLYLYNKLFINKVKYLKYKTGFFFKNKNYIPVNTDSAKNGLTGSFPAGRRHIGSPAESVPDRTDRQEQMAYLLTERKTTNKQTKRHLFFFAIM